MSTAFAQLAKEDGISDGITPPPHDRPLNFYSPCSNCHVRFDQWASAKFEIKKLAIKTEEDFKAVRDLQYQLAKQMAIRCTGSCGHPKNYQMHPPREQVCTLCHEEYLYDHADISMAINEFQPEESCGGCHQKGLEILGEKIPYWSMSFATLEEKGAAGAIRGLMERTQLSSDMVFPNPAIAPFANAEGKWTHEVKNRAGILVFEDMAEVAGILGGNLNELVNLAYDGPITGKLEGKVEATSDESFDAMQYYFLTFEKDLKVLEGLLKETKYESKFRPPLPLPEARLFIIAEVQKRFKKAEMIEERGDKIVWTVNGAEIKVEFKEEETKLKFSKFPPNPAKGLYDALKILSEIEKEFPEAIFWESKFAHTYAGSGESRWLIAQTVKDYVAELPGQNLKYELKGVKDTDSVGELAAILPHKVELYPGEDVLKLKTEIKVKFEKPLEPEVKSEIAISEAESE